MKKQINLSVLILGLMKMGKSWENVKGQMGYKPCACSKLGET